MSNTLELAPAEPRYVKVAAHLRQQLASGAFKPGDQLPSFPEMKARHGISQATMERAHAILEKEGLIMRRRGLGTFVIERRQLSTGVIGVAGITTSDVRHVPYYSYLMQGLEKAASRWEILLLNETSSINSERVDGVVGVMNEATLRRLPIGMPCVSILIPGKGVTSVLADDYDGIRQATMHLISLGHRRVAYLGALVEEKRIKSYRETLGTAGIEPLDAWVHDLPIIQYPEAGYREWGYQEMKRWLCKDWSSLGCTALITHNDYTAIGVMQAFEEAGLRVPSDVSVIGFDGTEVCDCFAPRVTSVEVPLKEIGQVAMQTLLDQFETPKSKAEMIMLPTRLQVRESTAPPTS